MVASMYIVKSMLVPVSPGVGTQLTATCTHWPALYELPLPPIDWPAKSNWGFQTAPTPLATSPPAFISEGGAAAPSPRVRELALKPKRSAVVAGVVLDWTQPSTVPPAPTRTPL